MLLVAGRGHVFKSADGLMWLHVACSNTQRHLHTLSFTHMCRQMFCQVSHPPMLFVTNHCCTPLTTTSNLWIPSIDQLDQYALNGRMSTKLEPHVARRETETDRRQTNENKRLQIENWLTSRYPIPLLRSSVMRKHSAYKNYSINVVTGYT